MCHIINQTTSIWNYKEIRNCFLSQFLNHVNLQIHQEKKFGTLPKIAHNTILSESSCEPTKFNLYFIVYVCELSYTQDSFNFMSACLLSLLFFLHFTLSATAARSLYYISLCKHVYTELVTTCSNSHTKSNIEKGREREREKERL